jgi:cyanate permease
VLAQASGPLLSGILFDLTGTYTVSLYCFATLSALSVLAAVVARQPRIAG